MEPIEITGSAIRRVDVETAPPLTRLRMDDLAQFGVTNAEQALRLIVQNHSMTVSASSVASNNGGVAYADLRGLGAARTLVLINGKRLVNNPYLSDAVDLNTLPMAALDRIEILSDGASAIYGSDAIAGVVNFITRKTYRGLAVTGDVQIPERGGGRLSTVGLTLGGGELGKDGWSLFGALNFRKQDALRAIDRDFSRTAYIPNRGIDRTSGTTFPANYSQGAAYSGNPTAPGCAPPYSLNLGESTCRFDSLPFVDLVPAQAQTSGLLKAAFALNKDQQVGLEYLRAQNTLATVVSATPLTGLSLSPASPFYPGNGTTPANPALDPTQPIAVGWRVTAADGRASRYESTAERLSLEFSGRITNWRYRAGAYRSQSTVNNVFTGGYLNYAAIGKGLNGIDGAPYLNPFGDQTVAGMQYLQSNLIRGQVQQAKGRLQAIDLQINGVIADLPGGPLALAFGAEYKTERNTYTNNLELIRQAAGSGLEGAEDSWGQRSSYALSAELAVPLSRSLEAGLAARYDRYSDFGGTFNPKLSLRWQPVSDLLLRGSFNQGFRAPTLQDMHAPNGLFFADSPFNDPVLCPNGVVDGAGGGISSRDCNMYFQQQIGGNRKLQPERSSAWTIGVVVQPTKSFSLGLDYWRYDVRDSIGKLGGTAIFAQPTRYADLLIRCSQATASERALIGACNTPGGDPLAYFVNAARNLGNYRTQGIDAHMHWTGAPGHYGSFALDYRASYIATYRYQLEPGGEYHASAGGFFNGNPVPRYKHVLTAHWSRGGWTSALAHRYTSSYRDANAEAGIDPAYWNTVRYASIWDVSLSYAAPKGVRLTVGVLNLLNTAPPFSNQATGFQVGYDQRLASPIGRSYLLQAAFQL